MAGEQYYAQQHDVYTYTCIIWFAYIILSLPPQKYVALR